MPPTPPPGPHQHHSLLLSLWIIEMILPLSFLGGTAYLFVLIKILLK